MVKTEIFDFHFIPAKKRSDKLMIVLHGKGDSLRPFKNFDKELNVENLNILLLNAPKKFLGGYSWYGDPPYQSAGVLKIREKMFQLLQELEEQGWKPENIVFFGFSQGCLISADIVLNYPKRFAGFIGISGYFQFYPRWKKALKENKKTPWLLTHGRKDDVLPIEDTRYGVEKIKLAGIKVDWIETDKKHDFEDSEYPAIRKWLRGHTEIRN